MLNGAVFPWRSGNRFELLVDGDTFFPRMLAAIAAARRQVEVESFGSVFPSPIIGKAASSNTAYPLKAQ